MAEIFQKAARVLCWLGHDKGVVAGSCFDFVKDATHQLACQWQSHWKFENLLKDLKLPDLFDGVITPNGWTNFRTLLNLPWFERLW